MSVQSRLPRRNSVPSRLGSWPVFHPRGLKPRRASSPVWELVCPVPFGSSCVQSRLGARVSSPVWELARPVTFGSSCVQSRLGARVSSHAWELVCPVPFGSSCVQSRLGARASHAWDPGPCFTRGVKTYNNHLGNIPFSCSLDPQLNHLLTRIGKISCVESRQRLVLSHKIGFKGNVSRDWIRSVPSISLLFPVTLGLGLD